MRRGERKVDFGQRKRTQQRGPIDGSALYRRHLYAALLVCESRKCRLPGADVLIQPEVALVAGDRRREVLRVIVRNRIQRPGIRKREQVLEHIQ